MIPSSAASCAPWAACRWTGASTARPWARSARPPTQCTPSTTIAVFPEGTRSPGDRIKPLKKGAFHLAQLAQVEVLPMIRNAAALMPRQNTGIHPGVIEVHVGEASARRPSATARPARRSWSRSARRSRRSRTCPHRLRKRAVASRRPRAARAQPGSRTRPRGASLATSASVPPALMSAPLPKSMLPGEGARDEDAGGVGGDAVGRLGLSVARSDGSTRGRRAGRAWPRTRRCRRRDVEGGARRKLSRGREVADDDDAAEGIDGDAAPVLGAGAAEHLAAGCIRPA